MKTKRVAVALVIVLLASGCASRDKSMQPWVGLSEGTLIASWGTS